MTFILVSLSVHEKGQEPVLVCILCNDTQQPVTRMFEFYIIEVELIGINWLQIRTPRGYLNFLMEKPNNSAQPDGIG